MRWWRRNATRRARQFFVGLAILAYLASAVGFPLPVFSQKKSGQPFPCQNHPCGCSSAEECWRHCCCFTPAERWAWARANHVEPPSYAERPASEAPVDSHCCADHDRSPTPSCCAHESSCCQTKPHSMADNGKAPPASRWVLSVTSQQCRGMPHQWLASGAAVPPPPVTTWTPAWPLVDQLFYADLSSIWMQFNPPDPPPRSFSG